MQSQNTGEEDDVRSNNQSKSSIAGADHLNQESPPFCVYQFIMASVRSGFPILTSEEAVTNCKSMFGVPLSVEDLLRPQVRMPSSQILNLCTG